MAGVHVQAHGVSVVVGTERDADRRIAGDVGGDRERARVERVDESVTDDAGCRTLGREGFDIRRFSLVRPRVDWTQRPSRTAADVVTIGSGSTA